MENGRVQKTSSGTREEGGRWGGVGFAIRKSHNKRKSSAFDDRSVSQCFLVLSFVFFVPAVLSFQDVFFFIVLCLSRGRKMVADCWRIWDRDRRSGSISPSSCP